ncbi:alpha/beta hydrolase family protein [Azospirillum himalayense]|uniref:Alpha/beta hydrolase family protein n=1 Tax=Azospirillum himalayense TaxID=654847 RepID=A0ABW0GDC1_9PROT
MQERIFLTPTDMGGDKAELIIERPSGGGSRPAVMLMHGHQKDPRPGAEVMVRAGIFRSVLVMGYVAAAVSMPGYGASEGQLDFCGPRSQAAVRAGLAHLRAMPGVDSSRIALCGWSRGAVVSAMVATAEPSLRALVLSAGSYDLVDESTFLIKGIHAAFVEESGGTVTAGIERSALYHVEKIKTPSLILHGDMDDRASVKTAIDLHERLCQCGCPSKLVIFPNTDHYLPRWQEGAEIASFLMEALGDPLG